MAVNKPASSSKIVSTCSDEVEDGVGWGREGTGCEREAGSMVEDGVKERWMEVMGWGGREAMM